MNRIWLRLVLYGLLVSIIAIGIGAKGCGGGSGGGTTGSSAPATLVKQGITDADGEAYFTDNSTGEQVKITVVDNDTTDPVPDMEVTYFDGNDYEGYYVEDPNEEYLPWLEVYEHNSDHMITLTKGEYRVEKVDNPDFVRAYWRYGTDPLFGHQITYGTTVSHSWFLAAKGTQILGEALVGIVLLKVGVGAPIIVKVAHDVSSILTITEILSILGIVVTDPPAQWDRYKHTWFLGPVNLFSKTFWMQSQPPTVTITNINVNGSQINAYWQGSDEGYYPPPTANENPMPDLTKYEGPTNNFDLEYSYRITNTSTGSLYLDWTSYQLGQTSASVSSIPDGDYRFEVMVKDEVENISSITSQSFSILNPTLAGSYDTPGTAFGVYVSGNYAYVADRASGLQVINISDPANPILAGSYNTPSDAYGVYVSGSYAYVAAQNSGLQIINISDPTNPTLAGLYDTPGFAWGVYVSGSYAYVADGYCGLKIINISNPATPTLAGSYNTSGSGAIGVYVSGSYAYVGTEVGGLQTINIADPANPTTASLCDTPGYAYGVYVSGSYAYVADWDSGLQIINISDPANPTLAGSYNTPGSAWGVYISGSYAYVADRASGLQVINISNPGTPTFTGSYDTLGDAYGVYVSGSYAYVADGDSGLLIIGGIE